MKILKANIMFVLPDAFEGTLNEALEEWALYKDFAVVHSPDTFPKDSVDSVSLIHNFKQGFRTVFTAEVWHEVSNGTWKKDFEPVPSSILKNKVVIK